MPVFKFSEVLNDTVSTLLWADLQTLLDFQRERQLPADLAQVFTTEASGDEVLAQGALIALAGIANLAYTVIVRVDDADAELLRPGSVLQRQQAGYVLRVTSACAALLLLARTATSKPSRTMSTRRSFKSRSSSSLG